MKKKIILSLAMLSMLSLVGCGNAGGNNGGSGNASDSQATADGYITFASDSYEIERNYTKTISIKTTGLANYDDKTVMFSSEGDGKIIQLAEQTEGSISIKVKGLRTGTATLVATSVANPNIKASVTINVVAIKGSLRTVWKAVSEYTNYTITSYDPDESETDPTSIVKVTEDAIVVTDKDGNALSHQDVVTGVDDNDEDVTETMDFYGTAISSSGYAYYLVKKAADGSWYTPKSSIQTGAGLLTKDNFHGLKDEASSFLDVCSYYGLQAINYSWLSNKKDETNTYSIEGSDSDINSAYTEALLWGLVDPAGKTTALSADAYASGYTASEAAALIDTTITVVDNKTVSITITESADIGGKTHVAYLTDIGTTTLDDNTKAYVAEGAPDLTKPTLASGLTAIKNAFLKHDYSVENAYTFGDFTSYYAPTYYWDGYTTEIKEAYEKLGYTYSTQSYAKLADGVYSFDLTQNYDADGKEIDPTITFGSKITSSGEVYDLQIQYSDSSINAYYSLATMFADTDEGESLLYTFRTISSNGSTIYYSSNSTIGDELSYIFFGGFTLKYYVDYMSQQGKDYTWESYGTYLEPSYDKTTGEVASVDMGFGTFAAPYKGSVTSGLSYGTSVNFTSCSTANKYDAAIKAAIEAKNAEINSSDNA